MILYYKNFPACYTALTLFKIKDEKLESLIFENTSHKEVSP